MSSKLLALTILAMIALTGCSHSTSQPGQTSPTAKTSKDLEFKVVSVARVNEWQPQEMEGITLTKGVSVTAVGGDFGKFEAEPGYEIAVVKISMTGGDGRSVPLENPSVSDDKGKTYPTIAGRSALSNEKNNEHEFGFAVPVKTVLTKIELNKTTSLDLGPGQ